MDLAKDMAIGATAGLIATGPMTLAMAAMHRSLPWYERHLSPPQRVTKNLLKHMGIHHRFSRSELFSLGAINHFLYGGSAGALYGPLAAAMPLPPVISGMGYGMLVWVGNYLGLLPALGLYRSPILDARRRTTMMVISHVIWGATLGICVAMFKKKLQSVSANSGQRGASNGYRPPACTSRRTAAEAQAMP